MKTPALLGIALTALASMALAQPAGPALQPLPADGFVALAQIVSEFTSTPEAAGQKYNGMRILVYGRVIKVSQSHNGGGDPLAVIMQLTNQSTPDVRAVFAADNIPTTDLSVAQNHSHATVFHRDWDGNLTSERSFIEVGQNVGIRGTFDKFVAGQIVLKDSSKLSTGDLMKKLREHGIATE